MILINIINKQIKKKILYKDTVVLKITIDYPQIVTNRLNRCINNFNCFYVQRAAYYEEQFSRNLYNLAIQEYENSIQNGFQFIPYEAIITNTITYNNAPIVSLYSDVYEYSGGAHGTTIRSSQTWNLNCCKMLELSDLLCGNMYAIDILKQINMQIAEQIADGTNQYLDNYCQLVIEKFNERNFYISDNNINIYYQQYDIAPYSSGIPVFPILIA